MSFKSQYRIKFEFDYYVVQKLFIKENVPTLWQMITGKRTFNENWISLDKMGCKPIFFLGSRSTFPEEYKTKEECISLIEKLTKDAEYFYPPDYQAKPTVDFNYDTINHKRRKNGYDNL